MVNRWCWPVQVRVLVGEQRGPAAVVEHVEQAAGHHDPAGRAGQRVGLDGVPGHDDDAAARGHAGGPPVGFGQRAGAGADHHRDRHRGRGQQQGRGHPGQGGDRVTAAEHRLRVVAQRGQDRNPGERRGGHQGQRGRAERGERDRGRGQQPGRQARLQPRRQRPGGRRRQHRNQQRQVDERVHPGWSSSLAEQLAQQPCVAAGQPGNEPAQHRPVIRAGLQGLAHLAGGQAGVVDRPVGEGTPGPLALQQALGVQPGHDRHHRAVGQLLQLARCQALAHLARAQRGARRPQHVHHFRLERAGRAPGRARTRVPGELLIGHSRPPSGHIASTSLVDVLHCL